MDVSDSEDGNVVRNDESVIDTVLFCCFIKLFISQWHYRTNPPDRVLSNVLWILSSSCLSTHFAPRYVLFAC